MRNTKTKAGYEGILWYSKTQKIVWELRLMHEALSRLIELMPDEQRHTGSELERIDSQLLTLRNRYRGER